MLLHNPFIYCAQGDLPSLKLWQGTESIIFICGQGGNRTHTTARSYDFESYASTSSATCP
jgi:hypothetical protein